MIPIAHILSRFPDAKPNDTGYVARCPAHNDRNPSLSIGEGDDGRALLKCFAGCTVESIVSAIGLRMADLMPSDNGAHRQSEKSPKRQAAKPAKVFPTADAAMAALERQHGEASAKWEYRNADGEHVGAVIRWDSPGGGKDIRPIAKCNGGWAIGAMPAPRPLYRIGDLADAERVYVCEGEKAADALRSLGLVATTSAGGAQAAAKSDWGPLAGKQVVILPDRDGPGRKYAAEVAAILAKMTPAPKVKFLELPELPDKGDACDFVEAKRSGGFNDGGIRNEIEALAEAAKGFPSGNLTPVSSTSTHPKIESWRPFPVDVLPEPARSFVINGAKSIGCDPSYLALPLLVALASAIGNTRRIQLKRGWVEPPIIWTAIIGESGTQKTPAFSLVMRPLRELQSMAFAENAERMGDFEREKLEYDVILKKWKNKPEGDPPEAPEEPQPARFIVNDSTVEALATILAANPRGVLLARDELAGWIDSFDRYANGKGGGDAAHWLSIHRAEAITMDRKTGQRIIHVPHPAVCIAGGIQPRILARSIQGRHRENGLAARLLMAWPPPKAKKWTEADITPEAEAELALLYDRLLELRPNIFGGDPEPVIVPLHPEAKRIWIDFYNEHNAEQAELTGDLAAAWSKIEAYAPRLALVVHFIRWAAGDPAVADAQAVDTESMASGIALARWFGNEAKRIYGILDETDEDQDRRRLVELIERKGCSVTVRDLMRSSRRYPTAEGAEIALAELVDSGWGSWGVTTPGPTGGNPSKRFILEAVDSADVDTTPAGDPVNEGSVNVGAVNGVEDGADTDGEWGEI